MEIEINNFSTIEAETSFLKKVAERVLLEEGKKGHSLSIALVDGKVIRRANKSYRGKDAETDVLSFADFETEKFPGQEKFLGEIILCPGQIKDGKKGMAKTLIHGILHLLGHNHSGSEGEERKMREKEAYYLSVLGKREK